MLSSIRILTWDSLLYLPIDVISVAFVVNSSEENLFELLQDKVTPSLFIVLLHDIVKLFLRRSGMPHFGQSDSNILLRNLTFGLSVKLVEDCKHLVVI